jgi:hypothetical protein
MVAYFATVVDYLKTHPGIKEQVMFCYEKLVRLTNENIFTLI